MFTPNFGTGGLVATNAPARILTTSGTTITNGGSANTLSASFTDLITPTFDVYSIFIILQGVATAGTSVDMLLNLYKGAGGSELLFVPSLLASASGTISTRCKRYWFPLFIPANTRISAKSQGDIASDTVSVLIWCFGGGRQPHWCGTGVEALGPSAATSRSVNVTNGTASEGSFTDIGTSTYRYGFVFLQTGSATDNNVAGGLTAHDIGVGGVTYPGLDTFESGCSGSEDVHNWDMGRFVTVPAGTALQARGQTSGNDDFDVAIYGVY